MSDRPPDQPWPTLGSDDLRRLSSMPDLSAATTAYTPPPVGTETTQQLTNPTPGVQDVAFWGGQPVSQQFKNMGYDAAGNALGWVGMFAGKGSATADLDLLKEAERMAAGRDFPYNISRTDIHANTGWFRGPDGIWKYEEPDKGMSYYAQSSPAPAWMQNLPGASSTLRPVPTWPGDPVGATPPSTWGGFVNSPHVEMAYPQLREISLDFPKGTDPTLVGQYGRSGPYGWPGSKGEMTFFGGTYPKYNWVAHETQHAIGDIERWPQGGNLSIPEMVADPVLEPAFRKDVTDQITRVTTPMSYDAYVRMVSQRGGVPTGAGYTTYLDNLPKTVDVGTPLHQQILQQAAKNTYNRISDEALARLTEKRLGMSAQERWNRPPWMDWDVPEHQQLVRGPMP